MKAMRSTIFLFVLGNLNSTPPHYYRHHHHQGVIDHDFLFLAISSSIQLNHMWEYDFFDCVILTFDIKKAAGKNARKQLLMCVTMCCQVAIHNFSLCGIDI